MQQTELFYAKHWKWYIRLGLILLNMAPRVAFSHRPKKVW